MDLLQNPFHILNASPRDNRRRIMELADEHKKILHKLGNITKQTREYRNLPDFPEKKKRRFHFHLNACSMMNWTTSLKLLMSIQMKFNCLPTVCLVI